VKTSIPLRSLWFAGLVCTLVTPARPSPAPAPLAPPPAAYRLAPADAVRIEVYLEPDLTTEGRIDESGEVRLPLVGAVRLAGLTIPEAQAGIERALAEGEFLRKAHVTVRIITYAQREVMISGQVRAPGSYALPAEGGMSLIDLIARAGGLTELARGTATITRTDETGAKRTQTFDAADLLRGKGDAKGPALLLRSGDIIFVPERIF